MKCDHYKRVDTRSERARREWIWNQDGAAVDWWASLGGKATSQCVQGSSPHRSPGPEGSGEQDDPQEQQQGSERQISEANFFFSLPFSLPPFLSSFFLPFLILSLLFPSLPPLPLLPPPSVSVLFLKKSNTTFWFINFGYLESMQFQIFIDINFLHWIYLWEVFLLAMQNK